MAHYEKKVDGEVVFQGKIIHVRHDYVELENGKVKLREVVVHPGAVVMLAVHEGHTYMVRQYRYCIGQELLEVPAGKLEKGETPLFAAMRELREETGVTAEKLVYFGSTYPSPGFCDEELHIYLALGLTEGEASPDEDEFLTVEKIDIDKLAKMIVRGELQDGKTISAVFMAREYLRNGQHR